MKSKESELREALHGRVRDHHRFMLRTLMEHLGFLEGQIARLSERIEDLTHPFAEAVHLLVTIPGIQRRTAEAVVAETGGDMRVFPTANHLASWAGICPGNNESAGKRKSGRVRKGNLYVRRLLCEFAHAASRTTSVFQSKFKSLIVRRGHKRSIVALAHKILRTIFFMIKRREHYRDSATDYEALSVQRNAPRWIKALTRFGFIPAVA
jgi:transposase